MPYCEIATFMQYEINFDIEHCTHLASDTLLKHYLTLVKVFINNETVPDFRGLFVQARRGNSTVGLGYFDPPEDET